MLINGVNCGLGELLVVKGDEIIVVSVNLKFEGSFGSFLVENDFFLIMFLCNIYYFVFVEIFLNKIDFGFVNVGISQVDVYDDQYYIVGLDFVEVDEDLDGVEVVIFKVKGVSVVFVFKYDLGLLYFVWYFIKWRKKCLRRK